jgi:hypothetical protein
MRTCIIVLSLVCAGTNALLLADWLTRAELALALCAAALLVLALTVAALARRLRL